MTTYHLTDAQTVSSANPTRIIDTPGTLMPPSLGQLFQFELIGPTTCTATFQAVGSLDSPASLPPQGTGGAWSNIGTPQTITCTTPQTPAVATVTASAPYTRWGCIVSSIAGGGTASARMEA